MFFSGSEPSSFKILCEYCPDDNEGFLPGELKQHIAELHPEFSFEPVDDYDDDIAELENDESTFGSGNKTCFNFIFCQGYEYN